MHINYNLAVLCFLLCLIKFSCGRKKNKWKKGNSKKPHIVFVLADDLGYNDIGYHARDHGSQMYTPFLDSLAAKGVKLENYYVQPICSPTRGQLLSGRYQIHSGLVHGVIRGPQAYGWPLNDILLPQQLRECGYKTHMIGKWHLGFYQEEYLPWKRGFNTFYGFLTGGENYFTRYKCELKKTRGFCGVDFVDSKHGATNKTWGKYSNNLFLQKAKKIIKNHKKTKPMFLYLALQSVHGPLQVPNKFKRRFKNIKDESRRVYGGMVLSMDKTIKQLSQYLKNAGMWKDTIFIFSTDNGGQTRRGGNNWPLRGNKGTLWEGGIKGVGFLHGKPLKLKEKGVINRQLIHVSDWFPTLMEASKCPIIDGTQPLDGFNQWNTITNNAPSKRTEILHNIDPLFKRRNYPEIRAEFDVSARAAIRSGRWKLLTGMPDEGLDDWVRPPECANCSDEATLLEEAQARNNTNNIKLYNIAQDPYEKKDLAHVYPEIVNLLLSRLVEYNASAVPAIYPTNSRRADPKLHNGYWLPWKKSKKKRKFRQKYWIQRKVNPVPWKRSKKVPRFRQKYFSPRRSNPVSWKTSKKMVKLKRKYSRLRNTNSVPWKTSMKIPKFKQEYSEQQDGNLLSIQLL